MFHCHQPGCSRSYKRKNHLLRHERIHRESRPYVCTLCSSAFHRRDVLKRHVDNGHSNAALTQTPAQEEEISPLGDLMSIALEAEIGREFQRVLLEQRYFDEFHPHWPVLDRNSFQRKPRPDVLVNAVLVAGLGMVDDVQARELADEHHTRLGDMMCKNLPQIHEGCDNIKSPRADMLPLLQTLMITLILSTYRDRAAEIFPEAIVGSKRLFQLLRHLGALDQDRIDVERSLDHTTRDEYQRLPLILFKVIVHLNALILQHLQNFHLIEYFVPAMLQVRVPSSAPIAQKPANRSLIGAIYEQPMQSEAYLVLGAVAAWDFSTGTILGIFLNRRGDESLRTLTERLGPYLFWHKKAVEMNRTSRKEDGVVT